MGKQVVQKLIRINHFEHIDLTEFWQYVEQKWHERDPLVMKKKRSLYVAIPTAGAYKGYVLGLLVSYKDEKTQTMMTKNAVGKKVITVSDIKGGMDYNFFIMSKINGVAIYQYYHNSASDTVLQEMLREIYDEFKAPKLQAELDTIPTDLTKTEFAKRQVAIKRKWHKWPRVNLVFKRDELVKVLSQWKQIQQLTYQIEEFKPVGGDWKPLENLVKSDKHILTFEPDSPVKSIATALSSLRKNLYRGKVKGIDEANAHRTVDLIDISENIAVYDFDELSKKIDGLELDSFSKSHVFKWIKDSVKERQADFNTPIQDDDED